MEIDTFRSGLIAELYENATCSICDTPYYNTPKFNGMEIGIFIGDKIVQDEKYMERAY